MSLTLPGYVQMWWHRQRVRHWERRRGHHAYWVSKCIEIRSQHEEAYSWLVVEASGDDWKQRRAEEERRKAKLNGGE